MARRMQLRTETRISDRHCLIQTHTHNGISPPSRLHASGPMSQARSTNSVLDAAYPVAIRHTPVPLTTCQRGWSCVVPLTLSNVHLTVLPFIYCLDPPFTLIPFGSTRWIYISAIVYLHADLDANGNKSPRLLHRARPFRHCVLTFMDAVIFLYTL
jgi:hypothetical protein